MSGLTDSSKMRFKSYLVDEYQDEYGLSFKMDYVCIVSMEKYLKIIKRNCSAFEYKKFEEELARLIDSWSLKAYEAGYKSGAVFMASCYKY